MKSCPQVLYILISYLLIGLILGKQNDKNDVGLYHLIALKMYNTDADILEQESFPKIVDSTHACTQSLANYTITEV